jgi:asparagine synthase (glutamine-hydrolysing)
MVLSGDGGDEGFGGYWSYDFWMKQDPQLEVRQLMRSALASTRELSLRAGFYWFRQSIRKYLTSGNDLSEWQKILYYLDDQSRVSLWQTDHQAVVNQRCELFDQADRNARHKDRLTYAQYMDYQTYLPCDILTKVDVASMYHGLEVRTPLIDLRVVELAARLPLQQRFRRNGGSEPTRKYLLKKVLEKTFSHDFVHREKRGFAIPRSRWFLPGQSARCLLEEVLLDRNSRLYEFFKPDEIRRHVEVHAENRDNSNALWVLLVLGLWLGQNPEVDFS